MVSHGLRDFLELLLSLESLGIEGAMMYGRCPDCWRPITTENPGTLIGDLLAHELEFHPEHAEHAS